MKSLSARSLDSVILGTLVILGVTIICSFALMPRFAHATTVTVSTLLSTSTPIAYTNSGLATTTRAAVLDHINFQLTTASGPPLTTPMINILGTGSTTMSSGGTNAWFYSTTTTSNTAVWVSGTVPTFKISLGTTDGLGATTTVTALTSGPGVTFDSTGPALQSVTWTNNTLGSTQLSSGDALVLTWNETMATTTLTGANLATVLSLTNSHIFSTTTAPTWNTAGTQLTINLSAGVTATGGDTVIPTSAVKDAVGNQDATGAALTIPAAVGIVTGGLTATSTSVFYNNTGLATTTRVVATDIVNFQLNLDATPKVAPQINIFGLGSTTMVSGGSNKWSYSTTTSAAWTNGGVSFKISVGGTTGAEATSTVTQATLTGTNVTFDSTAPTLASPITWADADSDGSTEFSAGDTLTATFSETMATTTISSTNLDTVLPPSTAGHSWGTAPVTISWNTAGTVLTVTLNSGTTITGADTVTPTSAVKDAVGNSYASVSAVVLQDSTAPSTPTGLSDRTFQGSIAVSLASVGSTYINYTTDGSTPTCSVGTLYVPSITVSSSITLKAVGCDEVPNASSVASAVYTHAGNGGSTGGGGGGGSSATPAIPAMKLTGCVPGSGDLFDVTSGKSCTIPATPASPSGGCSGGNLFNTATGRPCTGASSGSATSAAMHAFKSDLTVGSLGDEVKNLQKFLNSHGYTIASSGPGSLGNETTTFGGLTRAALVKYQKAKGITPAVGFFGPKTRASVSSEL